MPDELTNIPTRFRGPPNSGNGDYSCGILGALIGDCAEVTLKSPPPLEAELQIEESEGEWRLQREDQLIAVGRAAELEMEIPSPPTLSDAEAAEQNFTGWQEHIFPECFVCGPDREPHDGLRIFAGRVGDRDVVASHWLPGQDVAGAFGAVSERVVWAALDCPTYFASQLGGASGPAVLGRLTAKLIDPVEVDEPHIVVAWPAGVDDRKFHGGSAIFSADGELCAFAKGTWVRIAADHAGFAPQA